MLRGLFLLSLDCIPVEVLELTLHAPLLLLLFLTIGLTRFVFILDRSLDGGCLNQLVRLYLLIC